MVHPVEASGVMASCSSWGFTAALLAIAGTSRACPALESGYHWNAQSAACEQAAIASAQARVRE